MKPEAIQNLADQLEQRALYKTGLASKPPLVKDESPFQTMLFVIFTHCFKLNKGDQSQQGWRDFESVVIYYVDQLLILVRNDRPRERWYFIQRVFGEMIFLCRTKPNFNKSQISKRLEKLDWAVTEVSKAVSPKVQENPLFTLIGSLTKAKCRESVSLLREDIKEGYKRLEKLKGGHNWSDGIIIGLENLEMILSEKIKTAKPKPIEPLGDAIFERQGKHATLNQFITNACAVTGLGLTEKSIRDHMKKLEP